MKVILQKIADELTEHQNKALELDKISARYHGLTLEDAYEIQRLITQNTLKTGDNCIGWKMGLTSAAKQKSVGVEQPIYGRLLESMKLNDPELNMENLIHPRVEPEIAFLINKRLKGSSITEQDVWAATESIMPAMEIIDSRYRDFSFSLTDVVADNASSARFFISGKTYSPQQYQWDQVRVHMKLNGKVVQSGDGSAVLGNPVRSVVELVHMLDRSGLCIEPGMLVLTGAITDAVQVNSGDSITIEFEGLDILDLIVSGK